MRLRSFLTQIASKVPSNPIRPSEGRAVVGLKQYFRALRESTDSEEQTALAVASLEGFLLAGARGELKRTLSYRAAVFLEPAELDSQIVFQNIKDAYEVRSKYFHGESSADSRSERMTLLAKVLSNYARLVAAKLLELALDRENKNRLLEQLDEALLDESSRKGIQAGLRGGCWDLVLREQVR
ncbi:MAG TPA: hypothetical protein VF017_11315 [Thermoanaerobaculia bacterium]|nr:hypothetical protein [Thermoanaerobaculia bacterium]